MDRKHLRFFLEQIMNNKEEVLRERLTRIRQILENTHMNPDFEQIDAIYNLTKTEEKI